MARIVISRPVILLIFIFAIGRVFAESVLPGKMVARIPYGSREGELGVQWAQGAEIPYSESVSGIEIGKSGNIYLHDVVNRKIKMFSNNGELLALTSGHRTSNSFAVDEAGAIYVQSGENDITKFDVNQLEVWSHSFYEIFPLVEVEKIEIKFGVNILKRFGQLSQGPNNTIYIEIDGRENVTRKLKFFTLVMDTEGTFVQVLPSLLIYGNGYLSTYDAKVVADDVTLPTVTVNTYSIKGEPIRSFSLDIQAGNGIHYKGYSSSGGIDVLPDQQGGFFTITYASLDKPVTVTPTQAIKSEFVLNRYDDKGKFVEEIRFLTSPFMGFWNNNITVNTIGVVYYLQFDKRYVYIWAYDTKGVPTAKSQRAQYGSVTISDGTTNAAGLATGEFTAGPGVETNDVTILYSSGG